MNRVTYQLASALRKMLRSHEVDYPNRPKKSLKCPVNDAYAALERFDREKFLTPKKAKS